MFPPRQPPRIETACDVRFASAVAKAPPIRPVPITTILFTLLLLGLAALRRSRDQGAATIFPVWLLPWSRATNTRSCPACGAVGIDSANPSGSAGSPDGSCRSHSLFFCRVLVILLNVRHESEEGTISFQRLSSWQDACISDSRAAGDTSPKIRSDSMATTADSIREIFEGLESRDCVAVLRAGKASEATAGC